MRLTCFTLILCIFATLLELNNAQRPNIVIIMADDLGFDDVSFRGSNRFLTPNIDALAYSGVIIKNMYTPAMCTPSRAALLTGKYPIHTGMQHYVISNDQPWGLPLDEITIADIFQKQGYFTSIFGKWHLGMAKRAYTPLMRGFDKHFGYLGSFMDYYEHYQYMPSKNDSVGHDFRNNMESTRDNVGEYATHLLSNSAVNFIDEYDAKDKPMFMILSHLAAHTANVDNPLQAPQDEIDKFSYIEDLDRRTYAAMVSLLDKSVGQVIDALDRKKMLQNTIVLFYSDNGGPTIGFTANTASNYPLRGQKDSPWEGGVRSPAAIWSKEIQQLGTVWEQRFYVADILPTLLAAAGIQANGLPKFDGLDLWSALKYGNHTVEREIVHQLDDIENVTSYLKGKWKFINGTTVNGIYDGHLSNRSATTVDPRYPNYEQVICNTTVWQQLNSANVKVDFWQLRQDAQITCLFTNGSQGVPCQPLEAPCLFDIQVDPCEQNNLYEEYRNSQVLQDMLADIDNFRLTARTPANLPADPNSDPANFHGEWTFWLDEPKSAGNHISLALCWHIMIFFSIILLI